MEKPKVGQWVIYKFDRKIVGGWTEQRIGRDTKAVKIEGVEIEARALITRVHGEDSTVDLDVYAHGGQYSFQRVAQGDGEGEWHATPQAA